jgi:hypothetical protein
MSAHRLAPACAQGGILGSRLLKPPALVQVHVSHPSGPIVHCWKPSMHTSGFRPHVLGVVADDGRAEGPVLP